MRSTIYLNFLAMAAIAAFAMPADAARIISTFDSGAVAGADAELRESAPTQNRGSSTEIASRVAGNRNSLIYVKLPVDSVSAAELASPITFRMTYRNTNLTATRISDTSSDPTMVPDRYTGLQYYVLDPNNAGADWDESTITPLTAPGYLPDGNFGTHDIVLGGDNFTPIASQLFPEIAYVGLQPQENHLPVGGALDLTVQPGSALHDAIVDAQSTAHQSITIAAGTIHNNLDTHGNFINFNYLFNPKEQTTLNNDPNYDNNVAAGDGPEGSPWSGATNSQASPFAPQLLLVPEPSSVALICLAGLALVRRRR